MCTEFWLKEDFYMEQPQVDYDNTAIFEWQGTRYLLLISCSSSSVVSALFIVVFVLSRDGEAVNMYYSTSSIQNQLFEEYLRIPQLKVRSVSLTLLHASSSRSEEHTSALQ